MTEQRSDEVLDGMPVGPSTARPAEVLDASGSRGMTAVVTADDSLEDAHLLALWDTIVERRSSVDRAEADLLELVVEFADACPPDPDDLGGLLDHPSMACIPSLPALPSPPVAETAVVELGARLAISYRSAVALVGEAVELRDRLPRLWGLVQAGRLQAWKARQVARVTMPLPAPVAGFVDAHAAVAGRRNTVTDLHKLVTVAINRCDPDLAEGLQEAALANRGVDFDFSTSTDTAATAHLQATLDLLDALDLDATISHLAGQMARLGDDTPLGVRRAHALGTLANPQRTLDLFGDPAAPTLDNPHTADNAADDTADDAAVAEGPGAEGPAAERPVSMPAGGGRRRAGTPWDGQPRWNSQVGHLYLHLDAADLRALATDGHLPEHTPGQTGAVDLERLGAASLDLVREWLGRVTRVTLRPVLDLAAEDPVDRHDPPEAMREQVMIRDGGCVFPGCRVTARGCDLDHITPYVCIDDGGPPDQTTPANLACLCRRHHRMKTHHGWHYQRARDGTYQWTDPHGVSYTTASTPLRPTPRQRS